MTVITDRVAKLRRALERIASGPCTGRVAGCTTTLADMCPKHVAEATLAEDDWDAPL